VVQLSARAREIFGRSPGLLAPVELPPGGIIIRRPAHGFTKCGTIAGSAVVSALATRHIDLVSLPWDKLCAVAAGEIEATLGDLPAPLRARAAKLPVAFEPRPNAGLQADGIAADTLGLFTGAEFVEEESVPMPPQIILFLANLWEFAAGDEEAFCEEVHTTFLHELGHYLGLDEDDLTERGLD